MSCPYEQFSKPLGRFCEENLCAYITQPANSWSNLVYLIVGIIIAIDSKNLKDKFIKLLSPIAILIGLSSFIYHASWTLFGEFLDLGSMLFLTSYLISFNLFRLNPNRFSKRISSMLILLIVGLAILLLTGLTGGYDWGKVIFGIEVIIALGIEYLILRKGDRVNRKNLLFAVAILLIAWFIWFLDRKLIWCDANYSHLLNGHLVWHVLTSIALFFVYLFYKQFDRST